MATLKVLTTIMATASTVSIITPVAPVSFPPSPGKEAGEQNGFYHARCEEGREVEVRGEIDDACSNGVGHDADACRSGDILPVGAPLKPDAEICPRVGQAGRQCRHPLFPSGSSSPDLPDDSSMSADLPEKLNITRGLRACRGVLRMREKPGSEGSAALL
jgi:hypothetical protein